MDKIADTRRQALAWMINSRSLCMKWMDQIDDLVQAESEAGTFYRSTTGKIRAACQLHEISLMLAHRLGEPV